MVSTEKKARRRVSFIGANNEKLESKPQEDENKAAENSPGSFVVDAVIQIGHQHLQLVTNIDKAFFFKHARNLKAALMIFYHIAIPSYGRFIGFKVLEIPIQLTLTLYRSSTLIDAYTLKAL